MPQRLVQPPGTGALTANPAARTQKRHPSPSTSNHTLPPPPPLERHSSHLASAVLAGTETDCPTTPGEFLFSKLTYLEIAIESPHLLYSLLKEGFLFYFSLKKLDCTILYLQPL